MEIWYWMSIKKLEIAFELDLWPAQLTPHVYYYMHMYYTMWSKNRQPTYKGYNFVTTDEDSLIINKMLLDQCTDGARKRILQGYYMIAKIAYLKGLYTVFHFLYQNNLLKKTMKEIELGYAYDAKLTLNQDVFFVSGLTYEECKSKLDEELGTNPSAGLLAIKTELFDTSKILQAALKHLGLAEADSALLTGMSKVTRTSNLRHCSHCRSFFSSSPTKKITSLPLWLNLRSIKSLPSTALSLLIKLVCFQIPSCILLILVPGLHADFLL
jgi:hypothetical protein